MAVRKVWTNLILHTSKRNQRKDKDVRTNSKKFKNSIVEPLLLHKLYPFTQRYDICRLQKRIPRIPAHYLFNQILEIMFQKPFILA